ncbi:MAG: type I DNA topoisomerase [Rickettsiales bacterium]|jgi:DNA topoisomerase-1|nr:type I DNA topoisomerase [Rickettsiales bacterium]
MNLLIVESPAKAKTIGKYLGRDWNVVASVGHVRDLVPENGSVDPDNDYAMKWQIMPGKEKVIKQITDAVRDADAVYLASDADREGEAIAWHLLEILKSKKVLAGKPVHRITYNEITKKAVEAAIANPRGIDTALVDAYFIRRGLDYLIGFGVSPLLWRRNLGKSAGRVQSVAVALVVAREKDIEAFKPVEYWSLESVCNFNSSEFKAQLSEFENNKIEKFTIKTQDESDKILSAIGAPVIPATVATVEKKKVSRKPAAPFTTSTLQMDAARKLYFNSKRTMSVAQKLYEQGFITYMRTDSTNLSADAVSEIREFVESEYGREFLPAAPNIYITKSKNAQEAHEAIRPTHINSDRPSDADEQKLFDLILKRTLACQMSNAEFDSVAVDIKTANAVFHATGQTQTFAGFLAVYQEGRDDDADDGSESKLPQLAVGDKIDITELTPAQHFTQPPARFTEATLVKKMEELGIGRPSTYAAIMGKIVDSGYIAQDKSRRFSPTPAGWVITAYLSHYFAGLLDVNFTAKTEDAMDDVSNGKLSKNPVLDDFWKPTSKLIDSARDIKTAEIIDNLNRDMSTHIAHIAGTKCPKCGSGDIILKLGKYGAFLSCSNYPQCDFITKPDAAAAASAGDDDAAAKTGTDLGDGIFFKIGRFGPYVTDGKNNASAKKYTAETITAQIARELLENKGKKSEGVVLGQNPATDKDIIYYDTGRYGPYISSNKVNVSVKDQPDLAAAIELINNKKPAAKWKKK